MNRKFHILSYQEDSSLSHIDDYEMGDFDITVFWRGEAYHGEIPDDFELLFESGTPSDYLSNPVSWIVVSDRLLKVMWPFMESDCQVIKKIPLIDMDTREPVAGYQLLNPTRCIAATENPKARDVSIDDLDVADSMIPDELHIFRPLESDTLVLVSDEMVRAIKSEQMTGIGFLAVGTLEES